MDQLSTEQGGEYRVFGPPGTGKTHFVQRQVERAVAKFGADAQLIASFSKAAAHELAGRSLPIPRDHIGTLHSHCYRVLCHPKIAEANIKFWNEERRVQKNNWQISGARTIDKDFDEDEETSGDALGDGYLQRIAKWRGMLRPPEIWEKELVFFNSLWTEWKQDHELMDFTDLIETAYHDAWTAPGSPTVLFIDEAQDHNRLEMRLVRRWGERSDYFIVAGDDDQCLYSWRGATPDALFHPPLDPAHKLYLRQSYRVPRVVHRFATTWSEHISEREPKEYLPRDAEGEVLKPGLALSDKEQVTDLAETYLGSGKTVMILASCGYMLMPLIGVLRERGIPFANPYRPKHGVWNPLQRSTKKQVALQDRALTFLRASWASGDEARPWTVDELKKWLHAEALTGLTKRSWRKALDTLEAGDTCTLEVLDRVFEPEKYDQLIAALENQEDHALSFWRLHIAKNHERKAEYLHKIFRHYSFAGLTEQPKLMLGTIHSVKGGEADVVIVAPDLSPRAINEQWYGRAPAVRDELYRVFYVAITRARETLIVLRSKSNVDVGL